ncbi:arylamine N-acetyltransferase [Flavobacterium sp. MXW15]|uniref:Arylamine N-acetyltransferase n=1 Tax=Xanthomonas chitinilytica TaxID=2989819 RepID=A0ABT3JWZ2_9XANT|nr:arylamine N-acetyltransferase [Xanthomonas sp. H13-6]MCW4455788.1 arylamine N-acetyltransferase [Flavobacterium sp. MXW15]MCW4473004.1 arylamine N-acetyltransferase [Xanthomonas sp. H13-6]
MNDVLTEAALYLHRLGYDRPPPPTLATLRELQQRHTATFPFETISSLLRLPVPIDLPTVQHKLLHAGRGGYCYELNRIFLALLQELGFDARGLTARVVMGGPEDALTARTHLLVLVVLDGERHVADVGFGGMVPTAPLRLDTEDPQATPHEPYRITRHDGRYTLRALVGGEWRAMYVFDLQPQAEIDYIVGNWYVGTHPDSSFLGQLRVARTGPGWRRTLNNGSFAIHRIGQASERFDLPDADAVIAVLRDEFGIRVPAHPDLQVAIDARLVG